VQEKCNKMVISAIPLSHHLKDENSKKLDKFFLSFNYFYYVTLPIHSHAEVMTVTRYLQELVSCDVLGQRYPNYGPQSRFVDNENFLRKTC